MNFIQPESETSSPSCTKSEPAPPYHIVPEKESERVFVARYPNSTTILSPAKALTELVSWIFVEPSLNACPAPPEYISWAVDMPGLSVSPTSLSYSTPLAVSAVPTCQTQINAALNKSADKELSIIPTTADQVSFASAPVKVTFASKWSETHLPQQTSQTSEVLVSAISMVTGPNPLATVSNFKVTALAVSSQFPWKVVGVFGVVLFEK